MKRSTLAIDIDEVLFPLTPNLNEYYNEQHATSFRLADYVSFDLDQTWGLAPGSANGHIEAFLKREHRYIEPLPEALGVLRRLGERYRLVVVTARDGQFEQETRTWLLHHFPDYFDEIILAGNHFTGRSFRTKSEICRELEAVYMIDDGLHNILDCATAGIPGLLFGNYPWNQSAEPLPANVRRVNGWVEAERILLG